MTLIIGLVIRMTMVISESSCVWYSIHFINRYTLKYNEDLLFSINNKSGFINNVIKEFFCRKMKLSISIDSLKNILSYQFDIFGKNDRSIKSSKRVILKRQETSQLLLDYE